MNDFSKMDTGASLVLPDGSEAMLVGTCTSIGRLVISEHPFEVPLAVGDVVNVVRREAEEWEYVTDVADPASAWLLQVEFASAEQAHALGERLSGRAAYDLLGRLIRVTTTNPDVKRKVTAAPGAQEVSVLRNPGDRPTIDDILDGWF